MKKSSKSAQKNARNLLKKESSWIIILNLGDEKMEEIESNEINKAKNVKKKNVKRIAIRVILIVLIITNCITIFKFSSEQSEQSNRTSGKVVETIVENSPKTKNLSKKDKEKKKEEIVTPVRKTAHFTVYTCLGALIYLLCRTFEGKNWKKVMISIGFAFLYACSDEIHQMFVGGRSGEFRDVMIDSCGAGFGVLIVWIFGKVGCWIGRKKVK